MTSVRSFVFTLAMACCVVSVASAQAPPPPSNPTAKPDVADLLFGNPQWAKAPPGSKLTYSYSKKTTNAAFGPSFKDTIGETLEKGRSTDPDRRSIEVQMFSGPNVKPAGPFDAEAQNPVLLLVLEENVQELSKLFKGNVRYLKNAIRKAWRDDAKIETMPIIVGGKTVPGTRISITPFTDDPEKDQMMGLEGMIYVVEIADSVPGQIATVDIHAPASGPATFAETLHYVSGPTP